jgi:hypothetical protein
MALVSLCTVFIFTNKIRQICFIRQSTMVLLLHAKLVVDENSVPEPLLWYWISFLKFSLVMFSLFAGLPGQYLNYGKAVFFRILSNCSYTSYIKTDAL